MKVFLGIFFGLILLLCFAYGFACEVYKSEYNSDKYALREEINELKRRIDKLEKKKNKK